jgi:hypothetical protein
MIKKGFVQLLLVSILLSGCADPDFFQKDALVNKKDLENDLIADSVWVVAGKHYNRSGFHRFFWGNHNRKIWNTPVKAQVFQLHKVKGGLKIDKLGGGFQTTSFELKDSLGRQYAFRSVDKDPVHVLSKFWQKTFVTNVVRDQTSASNPYGALIVPVLAEAVGVYHTNPELYYVSGTDTSFGEHASLVQGKLFLLEEKFKKAKDLTPHFNNTTNFANSKEALQNRFKSNTYHFDQQAFARARLLDILIGDWDRHEGQWDWAVTKNLASIIYYPIPKDRDQVFIKMNDGLIPAIATSKLLARKFETFSDKISDLKALMINSEFIDARLLNELTRVEFIKIAKDMQLQLTDKVIEQAVRALPATVYKEIGRDIIVNLKRRREQLPATANKMYAILAKEVTIVGSDQKEIFKVTRLDDDRTEVTVMRPSEEKEPENTLYHRVFNRHETELIILHGLAGDDAFLITGKVNKGIKIKVYGGLGEDDITDKSSVSGWKKHTEIYDTERGNNLVLGAEAADKTTKDVRVHAYDREGY